MIALAARQDRRDHLGGQSHDIADPRAVVTGPVVIDSRRSSPAACSSPSRASASTATTSPPRPSQAGAVGRARRPARRRPRDRRGRRPWPRSARSPRAVRRPAADDHGRRRHRLGGQDQHQGPDRPAARRGSARPSAPPGSLQQRDRPAAHRAAAPTRTPATSCWRWAPAASATSATSPASPRRESASSSTSAPPTSASSAAASRSPRPRASWSRRCRARRRRRAQRRRPAGARAWPPRTEARVALFGAAEDADVRAEDVSARRRAAAPPSRCVTPTGCGRRDLRLYGEHHVSNALAAAAVAHELGMPVAEIAAALSEAGPRSRWRMEVTERAGRRDGRQRRLQREPRVHAGRAAAPWHALAGGAAASRCSARWRELGDESAARRGSATGRADGSGLSSSAQRQQARGRSAAGGRLAATGRQDEGRRVRSRCTCPTRGRRSTCCAANCGRGTSCW